MSRTLTLRLTNAAEADLADIWAYVAAESSEATATNLVAKIQADCGPLCHFPAMGVARDHFAPGLRASFSGSFVIYYLYNEQELIVVRVLHGARDAAALAEFGAFLAKPTSNLAEET